MLVRKTQPPIPRGKVIKAKDIAQPAADRKQQFQQDLARSRRLDLETPGMRGYATTDGALDALAERGVSPDRFLFLCFRGAWFPLFFGDGLPGLLISQDGDYICPADPLRPEGSSIRELLDAAHIPSAGYASGRTDAFYEALRVDRDHEIRTLRGRHISASEYERALSLAGHILVRKEGRLVR